MLADAGECGGNLKVFFFFFFSQTAFILLLLLFFWLHHLAGRILVPNQGLNPGPLQWKHRVLTTAPPGNSLNLFF